MSKHRYHKRIVSKTRYAGIMGERVVTGFVGTLFCVVGGCGTLLMATLTFFAVIFNLSRFFEMLPNFGILLGLLALFVAMAAVGRLSINAVLEAEPVVPMTRQVALDLSEEETLVRGSSVSEVAQETVLLRPAQAEDETPKEELLRPMS